MKKMAIRFIFYGVGLLYLVLDLYVFDGPLRTEIESSREDSPEAIAAAKARGVVARVFYRPILKSQVEREIEEQLYLIGMTPADVPEKEMKWRRIVAVNKLVDELLLRFMTGYNEKDVPVSEEEVSAELALFVAKFDGANDLESALKEQGIKGEKELRYRLKARLQQERYLLQQISPSLVISEEVAREFYTNNRESYVSREAVQVRHIFIESLDRGEEAAWAQGMKVLTRLLDGSESFESLAQAESDDLRTKNEGGDLGWIARDGRLPLEFVDPVMLASTKTPFLLRTRLGVYVVEVRDRRETRQLNFEEVRDDVTEALSNAQRAPALERYRRVMRYRRANHVEIFDDVLHGG